VDTHYLSSLKTALLGTPVAPLVVICNFEAEATWARNYIGLPAPPFSSSARLVARMEELGILLAGSDDVLILKRLPDPGYVSYLEKAGFQLPTVVVPENVQPDRSTTEDVLDSPELLARLAEHGRRGAHLLPMATTAKEQELAEICGLPLAVSDAATFERVNSKIFSRRLVEDCELRAVPGDCCETCDDLSAVLERHLPTLGPDAPVVVKEAYGVSGKGLIVLDEPAKATRLLRMVERRAQRTGDRRMHVVVEQWLPKRCDLNYQVTVTREGQVSLDFVKQALTEGGAHKGHIMPADLSDAQRDEITQAADLVGHRLHREGFFGVVGIDAIIGADEMVYPVLEINARLNMSTYQGGVTERCQSPGHVALARHFTLSLKAPVTFGDLATALGPLLEPARSGQLVVTCSSTVNADADQAPPFSGRLYTLLVAPDQESVSALEAVTRERLATVPACEEVR
jgi:D-alanine-D-alanine ligase-like ATP-grasp enzyme